MESLSHIYPLSHNQNSEKGSWNGECDTSVAISAHPLEIKPAGNAYTASLNLKTTTGNFRYLPDELIIQILEELDSHSLLRLGSTCKTFYAFCRFDDLWKTLLVESYPHLVIWRGSWRSTYFDIPCQKLSKISCRGLFTDVLHRPFFCANTPLKSYTINIPSKNRIPRLLHLSATEYSAQWTNKPFILLGPVKEWPVYREWSMESLLERYSETKFIAEAVEWPLQTYVQYMNGNSDESPLYLFDRSFVEKMQIKVGRAEGGQYWAPDCFGEDLFAVLGDKRPDSRWLIIGPERSGSTFHKDPNATSAWNAVLRGSKYWIMFPSSSSFPPPPGVFVSEDQSEVTSPLSIAEWLIEFHSEARETRGCMEGICEAGEVLHVPSGWWHLVVNLSPSIAITQNFVPKAHLNNVLAFLRDKPGQVSGFTHNGKDPYKLFSQRIQENYPGIWSEALIEMGNRKERKKRKWEALVQVNEEQINEGGLGKEFSFGFGDADDANIS